MSKVITLSLPAFGALWSLFELAAGNPFDAILTFGLSISLAIEVWND